MRRKSKKTREESKVDSSSERRSKRSSSRRKKTYDDDEGGSGVEEGRTTEEETNQSKGRERGSRRYATRGRRQKVEESEEEESQNEGAEGDEESSNTYPVTAEADDGDEQAPDSDDGSGKGLKAAGGVADTASVEIDESSACNSDNQYWEMKTAKDDQGDKRGETFAHGEGDDGEEGVPRSHSRRKKLKLSRECLHENREAIPKIRLRLSRNRSGGYETEKVEAERIESKAGEGEPAVEVIKVESIPEEAEEREGGQSSEPSESVETGLVEQQAGEEETVSEVVETEPDSGQIASGEMAEPDTEVDDAKNGEMEVMEAVIPDNIAKVEPVDEVSPQENEETDSFIVGTVQSVPSDSMLVVGGKTEQNEVSSEGEIKLESSEAEVKMEVEDSSVAGEKGDEPSVPVKEERVSDAEEERAEGETVSGDETTKVKEERREEGEEEVGEVGSNQVSTSNEVGDAKKDEGEEELAEGNVEVPVGGAIEEVAEGMNEEAAEGSNEEAAEGSNEEAAEGSNEEAAEGVNEETAEGMSEEVAEVTNKEAAEEVNEEAAEETNEEAAGVEVEKEESNDKNAKEGDSSAEVSISKGTANDSAEDNDVGRAKKSDSECQNDVEEMVDVQKREGESHHKGSSGERVSRINRSRLRQEDDRDEDVHSQKRKGRRKRSLSGGEDGNSGNIERQQVPVAAPEQPQPKRVTLKRPKLIRTTGSSSSKDKETEGKDEKNDTICSRNETSEEKEKGDKDVMEDSPDVKEDQDGTSQEPKSVTEEVKKRRRKWGHNKNQSGPSHSRRAFISISSQSLKGLIPEVKPLPVHELRLSIEKDDMKDICVEEEESCDALGDETIVRMIDTNGQNERTVWAQVVDDSMRPTVHPEAPRVPAVGGDVNVSTGPIRRISIVSDDAVRLQRSPSPPRHPPSNVLFLSNLVRPFTVQQLKELLARTGTVVEDGFWIDRIKSMCLVQYETEEQARETRHALHGVRWPISNPKRLWVDFSTKEKLEEAKREGNAPALPPASGPSLSPPHSTSRDDFPRKTEPLRMDGSGLAPTHSSHRGSPGQPGHINLQGQVSGGQGREGDDGDNVGWQQRGRPRPEPPPLRPGANAREFKMSAPVREWDLDKVVQQSPPRPGVHGPLHGGAMDERRRPDATGQPSGHRDRGMPSPPASMQDLQARKAKRKEAEAAAAAAAEAPANLLDSLFRKTKATPSIYWLPLTADQIKVKEEIRRQHLAEHERRMAEMKRAAAKERAGRRRRRSSSPRRRSRRRSGGDDSGAVRKRPSESIKGRKAGSASPKK